MKKNTHPHLSKILHAFYSRSGSNRSFQFFVKALFTFVIVAGLCGSARAQTIQGTLSVVTNSSYTYSYNEGDVIVGPTWTAVKGTVTTTWNSGTTYYATVTWTTAGTGSLKIAGTHDGTLSTVNITITACSIGNPTASNVTRCGAGTMTLTATTGSGGNTVRWYSASTGGTLLVTATSYTTPSQSTGTTVTYYITSYNTSTTCESTTRTPVTATAYAVPSNPYVVSAPPLCGPGVVTLTGSAGSADPNDRVIWYSAQTGGSFAGGGYLNIGTTYSPSLSATTTYYMGVYNAVSICETAPGSRVAITGTINALPAAPASGTGGIICNSGSVLLLGSPGSGGDKLNWYSNSSGGTPFATATSYQTPTLTTTTTYYVSTYNSTTTCESSAPRLAITATVNPSSQGGTLSVTSATTFCGSGTASLSLAGYVGSIVSWNYQYNDGAGWSAWTNFSSSTSATISFTTLTTNGTAGRSYQFQAQVQSGSCSVANSTSAAVAVNPVPAITVTNNLSGLCSGQSTSIGLSSTVPGTLYSWSSTPSNVAGSSNGTNQSSFTNQTLTSTGSAAGSVGYAFSSSFTANGFSCTGSTGPATVNVNPVPQGTLAANTPTICGSATVTLTLSGAVGTIGGWTYQTNTGSGWNAPTSFGTAGATSNTFGTTPNGSSPESYQFQVQIQSGACTAISPAATVTNNPIPTAAASGQSLFTSYATSIAITNPNGVAGTTYSWTVSPSNVSGASLGSGSTIAQTLATTTSSTGTATYTITPAANSCPGTPVVAVATVLPAPSISVPTNRIVMGASVAMDGGAGYTGYTWKNQSGTTVGTTETFSTNIAGNYTITVTKSGVTGAGVSAAYTLVPQLSGQAQNYVVSNAMIVATSDTSRINYLPADSVNQSIGYYDGLGRLMQTVSVQGSPSKKDLVQPKVYDVYNREYRKYLPFTTAGSGLYNANVLDGSGNYQNAALNFYNNGTSDKIADDSRPFTETFFEASPLNRPSQDYGLGQNWKDNSKNITHNYLTNVDGTGAGQEKIIAWVVTSGMPVRSTLSNTSVTGGCYKGGLLMVKSTIDEQGHEVREYTDKDSHVILKKVQLAVSSPTLNDPTQWTQTYYVYDYIGNLRFVFQPELSKSLAQGGGNPAASALSTGAFVYRYDGRNRMIVKKVPGADSVFMVYDNRNRLVLTQDGNQRPSKQWLVTKYDSLDRPVMTAIYTHTAVISQSAMSGQISTGKFCEYYIGASASANHGYSLNVFPKTSTSLTVLTVNYYDNYNFLTDLTWGSLYNYTNGDITGQVSTNNGAVTGEPTGGKTNVLSSTNYLKHVVYYDSKYRTIQAIADNNKSGWDRVTSLFDFAGRVLNSKITHHTSTHSDQTVSHRLVYDHMSRMKQVFHTVNTNTEVLLVQNAYNEIGQLVDKGLYSTNGGSTVAQSLDYRYNIRGWLQSMNNSQLTNDGGATNDDTGDLFGMEMAYNAAFGTGTSTGNTVQYNGNISAMKWSTNLALGTVKDVAYNYGYDPLNRIASASYLNNTSGTWANSTGAFSESGYTYDQNGNIKTLVRNSSTGGAMDNLTYSYTVNQLLSVSDAGDKTTGFVDGNTSGNDYSYDTNGNMVYDKNKSLTASNAIQYNYLNLPLQVTKSTSEKIVYTYDATGRKLKQQVYNSTGTVIKTTDYDGDFIYQGDTLQFINHDEGRVVMKGTTAPEYQFHLKDHLGNVRLTFTTQIATNTYTAGFETANQTAEAANFTNYPTSSHINTVTANAHTGNNSLYLNGGYSNSQIGVTKSFSVMPGDVVSIQAYAKYSTPTGTGSNLAGFAAALLSAFNLTAPLVGETGTARSAINSWGAGEAGGYGDGSSDNTDPKVFVTILIFDRNYNFLDVAYQQLTSSGVMNTTYPIKQAGYAFVYVSNEQAYQTDVYFDDVTVSLTPSPVVETTDYYPFGLTSQTFQRQGEVTQNFKYRDKEQISDLALDWDDFGGRMYMPEIGRWTAVDPKGEKYANVSPYNYVLNNPLNYFDPDGKDVFILIAKGGAGGMGHMGAIIQDGAGNWYYISQGADIDPKNPPSLSKLISGVKGGMTLQDLGTTDEASAVELAKEWAANNEGTEYTNQIELHTSPEMDSKVFATAQDLQTKTNSGEKKYKVITNNCKNTVQNVFKGSGTKLPNSADPRPNQYYTKLANNIKGLQNMINKAIAKSNRQEERKEKREQRKKDKEDKKKSSENAN